MILTDFKVAMITWQGDEVNVTFFFMCATEQKSMTFL